MKHILLAAIFFVICAAITWNLVHRREPLATQAIETQPTPTFTPAPANDVGLAVGPFEEQLPSDIASDLANATLSKFPIELIGTVIRPMQAGCIATVRISKGGPAENHQVGETLGGAAKILAIVREKLLFKNLKTGKPEYVKIGAFDPSKVPTAEKIDQSTGRQEFHVERAMIDHELEDMQHLLQGARVTPVMNPDGTVRAFQIKDIAKGSVFEKLGLIDGDTLLTVNRRSITNTPDAIQAFNELRNSSLIILSIERNGIKHDNEYLIR